MREVRCPKCGRLLAIRRENGLIESKTGRLVIVTERALLSCLKCGGEVMVKDGEIVEEKDPSLRSG